MKELIVVSECVDERTGSRFQPGAKFPVDALPAQITRLKHAGCIKEVDLNAAPAGVKAEIAVVGAVNELSAAVDEKKAEAGRLAHGGSAVDEVVRDATDMHTEDGERAAREKDATAAATVVTQPGTTPGGRGVAKQR